MALGQIGGKDASPPRSASAPGRSVPAPRGRSPPVRRWRSLGRVGARSPPHIRVRSRTLRVTVRPLWAFQQDPCLDDFLLALSVEPLERHIGIANDVDHAWPARRGRHGSSPRTRISPHRPGQRALAPMPCRSWRRPGGPSRRRAASRKNSLRVWAWLLASRSIRAERSSGIVTRTFLVFAKKDRARISQ
jgi:hypothetical protein